MVSEDIPNRIREFIFKHIDSIEQLEVLFILLADPQKSWSPSRLSDQLRSNPASIINRLKLLQAFGLVKEDPNCTGEYKYSVDTPELDFLMRELFGIYQTHRHKIFELIYSPLKAGRDFADAFRLSAKKGNKGEDNG